MAGLLSTCETPCSPTPSDQHRTLSPDSSSPEKLISPSDTPRKNKRKLSEPRRRSDFSIKRFCPDSPGSAMSHSGGSGSEDYEPTQEDPPDTPEPCNTFNSDIDDTSQGLSRRDEMNHLSQFYKGVHSNCIMPNLYYGKPNLAHNGLIPRMLDTSIVNGLKSENNPNGPGNVEPCSATCSVSEDCQDDDSMFCDASGKRNRKNYKNMTRERRVEANARERSRVHTISAAFDSLRRAVPSYSYNQKLSKLAILRIASSYIMALSSLADDNQKSTNFADCVDMCTQTIQTEGRARRRH